MSGRKSHFYLPRGFCSIEIAYDGEGGGPGGGDGGSLFETDMGVTTCAMSSFSLSLQRPPFLSLESPFVIGLRFSRPTAIGTDALPHSNAALRK
jgi:hypothetical protein